MGGYNITTSQLAEAQAMETSEKFESWAILEIFGHTQIAGKVTEASIGGCAFVRVDVPEINGAEAFTKFYGDGAIYSLTPCSEEAARIAATHIKAAPVSIWMPEIQKKLPVQRVMDQTCCNRCGEYGCEGDCE
jgi:hypothetical protein